MPSTIPTALCSLFPEPMPLTLAGREFVVDQLRLRDLAELERWLAGLVPLPLEGIPAAGDDPDPPARKKRLRAAYASARAWPPAFGGDAARALMATPSGVAAYLWVVLSRGNAVTPGEAAAVAAKMMPAEWAELDRVAWGILPWEEMARELYPDEGARPGPEGADWGEVLDDIARAYHLTYAQVADLPLSQVRCMRRGGKPPKAPGVRSFGSLVAAIAWHNEQRAEADLATPEASHSHPT